MIKGLMLLIIGLIIYVILAIIQIIFIFKHDDPNTGYYTILTVFMNIFTVILYVIILYLFIKYRIMT